jgi:hypothetical protein
MLQWETADENADYPFERYRAVSGKHEYRVFHDPTGAASQDLPWILVVREVPEGGVYTRIHHGTHHTAYDAKLAAERQDKDLPPQ